MVNAYFENVKEGDRVFGLIFGIGSVRTVMNGFYKFEVQYENGQVVPYTDEGIPSWNVHLNEQTVYYKGDIDLYNFDAVPVNKVLTPKKIIKYRNSGLLQLRCPSGLWRNVKDCPTDLQSAYLEDAKFYLFRKEPRC